MTTPLEANPDRYVTQRALTVPPAYPLTWVYVAGPMTGIPEHNFPAFNDMARRLQEEGLRVMNPAARGVKSGWEWEDYMRADIALLIQCDSITMLPGWENSRGAKFEYEVATTLGLHQLYPDDIPATEDTE